jgi:hypothetical protein
MDLCWVVGGYQLLDIIKISLAWSWCEGPRLIFGSTKFGIYLPGIETGTARPWMQLVLPQVPVRQVLV